MTAVYRCFADDGTCLYVGCSDTPWNRIAFHSRRDDFPQPIANVSVTYHASKVAALDVEKAEIKQLAPAVNVMSLRPVARGPHGEYTATLLAAMREAGGPVTTNEIAAKINSDIANVASVMSRLRSQGIVRQLPTTGRAGLHEILTALPRGGGGHAK